MIFDRFMTTRVDSGLFNKNKIEDFSLLLGSIIIIFAFAILLIASLTFLVGWSISAAHFILGLCLTVGYYFINSKLFTKKLLLAANLTFLAVLFVSVILSKSFYDISWDGQVYHQEAVIQLANGWNPFHQISSPEEVHKIWLTHYAKGSWVDAAALYQLTHSIETSKAFNILFIISSFFLGISALINIPRINVAQSLILSGLLAFNPVSICQSLSFYIDGQQASLLVSLLAISYLLIVRTEYIRLLNVVYLANICILANIKFTSLVYASILIFSLIVWLLIKRNSQLAVKVVIVGSLSLLLGVGFIGYNPYVTNTFYHGHPFYPLAGANKIDIISTNIPKNFIGKNRLEKLFLSTFSESASTYPPEASKLKLPLTIQSVKERECFTNTDVRVAGFGPLFSGAILLSLIACLLSLRRDLIKTRMTVLLASLLMSSILINPEAWWARYVPQLWMLPLLFSILALSLKSKILNFLGYGIIVVLLANILIVSSIYFENNFKMSQAIEQQLSNISNNNQMLIVNFDQDFRSNRIRFIEENIKYREVKTLKELPCNAEQIVGSRTLFCIN
jgi:hypothetical protein